MPVPIVKSLRTRFAAVYRRLWSNAPTSTTPEADLAWQQRQFRYYATNQPFASPLSMVKGNLTGETWEMRQAYREWAFKEPALKASLLTKCLAVAQLSPQVMPASRKPNDKAAAKWVDWAVANSEGGWPGLILNMLLPALIDGFSVNEKVWGHVDEHGDYYRRWTLKQAASLDTRDIRFRLDTYREVVGVHSLNGAQTGVELDPKTFIIFTHLKIFENPFGISDVRAAVRACRLIESAMRLRHILLTNHSGPFIMAKAGDAAARATLMRAMEDARANGWIVVPVGTEMEILNLATANIDTFRTTIEDYQQEIVRAIHGAYLQLLEGGIANGRGNTNVHNSVSQLFQWWLSVLVCQYLNKQLVQELIEPSYGYESGLPRISLEGIDDDAVMKALDKFKKGQELGVGLSSEQVSEVGGFEMPENDADKLAPPSAGGQPGGDPNDPFGLGGGSPPPAGPPDDPGSSLFSDQLVHVNKADHAATVRDVALRTFRGITSPGVWAFDDNTSMFAEWRNYTNPRTGKSGWISAGGQVRYDDPRAKEEAKKGSRSDAAAALSRALTTPERISDEDFRGLNKHFDTLDAPTLKGIARGLMTRLPKHKAEAADRILVAIRQGKTKADDARAVRDTADKAAVSGAIREYLPALNTHPALRSHDHTTAGNANSVFQGALDEAMQTRTPDAARRVLQAARDKLDHLQAAAPPDGNPFGADALVSLHGRYRNGTAHPNELASARLILQSMNQPQRNELAARIGLRGNGDATTDALLTHMQGAAPAPTPAAPPTPAVTPRPRAPRRTRAQMAAAREATARANTPQAPPPLPDGPPPKAERPKNVTVIGVDHPSVHEKIRQIMGLDVTTDDGKALLAAAANAADGARVSVNVSAGGSNVRISTMGRGYTATRTFGRTPDGKPYVHNDYFRCTFDRDPSNPGPPAGRKPKGWKLSNPGVSGSKLLNNQIAALREMGMSFIETDAARSDSSDPNQAFNGYYTWPRLGYDAAIPPQIHSKLPAALKQQVAANPTGSKKSPSVLDLMTTQAGRDWWQKNGDWLHKSIFDLTDNSLSLRTNAAYAAEQAAERAARPR